MICVGHVFSYTSGVDNLPKTFVKSIPCIFIGSFDNIVKESSLEMVFGNVQNNGNT